MRCARHLVVSSPFTSDARSSAPNETHVSGQMYQMALYVRSKVASSATRHKSLNSFKEVSDISLLRLNSSGKDYHM